MKHLSLCLTLMGLAGAARAAEAEEPRAVASRLTLFASNDEVRTTNAATGLNLGLSVRALEFGPGLSAEAEVSLFALAGPQGQLGLRDNASFVRLSWRPESWAEGEGLALTVLPLSSTRLHLGYEFPATWGRFVYTLRTSGAGNGVPGAELRLVRSWGYAFAAAKSTLEANERTLETDRLVMALAGAGVDVLPVLRLEAAGALAQHGQIPGLGAQGIERLSQTLGVSGRALYHQGAPIGPSVDFTLYRQDPAVYETLFAPEAYPDGVSASVSLEGTHLVQDLTSSDLPVGETAPVGSDVLALQARLKVDRLRVHALGLYRSAMFLVSEVPGLPPFRDLRPADVQNATLLTVGADYHLPRLGLTPGLLLRAEWPASFQATALQDNVPVLVGKRVVIRGPSTVSLLPEGRERQPQLLAKATARWDPGSRVTVLGEVFYTYDPNRTTFRDDAVGIAQPVPEPPSSAGFSLLLQLRF